MGRTPGKRKIEMKINKNGKISYVTSLNINWCSLIPNNDVDNFSHVDQPKISPVQNRGNQALSNSLKKKRRKLKKYDNPARQSDLLRVFSPYDISSTSAVRVSNRFDLHSLCHVLRDKNKSNWRRSEAYVRTLYKRKDKKVRLVDFGLLDRSIFNNFTDWKDKILIPDASEKEKSARFR